MLHVPLGEQELINERFDQLFVAAARVPGPLGKRTQPTQIPWYSQGVGKHYGSFLLQQQTVAAQYAGIPLARNNL